MDITNQKKPKIYTGIGSRQTPQNILELIEKVARKLAKEGYLLRSGGAPGADSLFEKGCDKEKGKKEIYLPWRAFNKNTSNLVNPLPEAFKIAQEIHPAWSKCSPAAKKLHARNIHQVLGKNLNDPTSLVVYWAKEKDGEIQGGSATAVNLATNLNIPTFNLLHKEIREKWENSIKDFPPPAPTRKPNPHHQPVKSFYKIKDF